MINYPQINLNPYSTNQNLYYGYPSQTFANMQNALSPVTDNIQTKPTKKDGLSNYAKFGIGIGVATALAIGADVLFCKGKHVKNLWKNLKGNSRPNSSPSSSTTSNASVVPKKINFFEQRGLKINKGVVSNADGTLYTGSIELTNKNGEKFILKYKDGTLQKSEKYAKAGEFVSSKKYSKEIETGFDNNRVPYPIKKRYMYEYNKDGKIINATLVIEKPNHMFFINNKYCTFKNNKEVIVRRFASKDGKKYGLFDNPYDKESGARSRLGLASGEALQTSLAKRYPLSK